MIIYDHIGFNNPEDYSVHEEEKDTFKQRWHVERAKILKIDGEKVEQYYDIKNDFDSYQEAEKYFTELMPIPGERAYLEYSDNYQACILAVVKFA